MSGLNFTLSDVTSFQPENLAGRKRKLFSDLKSGLVFIKDLYTSIAKILKSIAEI